MKLSLGCQLGNQQDCVAREAAEAAYQRIERKICLWICLLKRFVTGFELPVVEVVVVGKCV